jgi:hypothetical protein
MSNNEKPNNDKTNEAQRQARLEEIGKCITDFVNDDRTPAILKWGLQILFIATSDDDTKSGVVGGLLACGHKAFDNAISKSREEGNEALATKLEKDKNDMIKLALQVDFRGAVTSVLRTTLGQIAGDGEEAEEAPAPKVLVVKQPKPSKESNPFAGRN